MSEDIAPPPSFTLRDLAPDLPDYSTGIRRTVGGIVLQNNENKSNVSEPYRDAARLIFERAHAQHPEIVGITGFGSSMRNEAIKKADGTYSDLDATILIDIDQRPDLESVVVPSTAASSNGETKFLGMVDQAITRPFVESLVEITGIQAEHDIEVRPVSQKIITEQASKVVKAARYLQDHPEEDPGDPRSYPIRATIALFCADIAGSLDKYRQQALEEILRASDGDIRKAEQAWQLVRNGVVFFEAGRGAGEQGLMRKIPDSFEEAVEFYKTTR